MARDHICFVQAQSIPWSQGAVAGRDVEFKVLSRDTGTGACTMLLRYAAGFTLGRAHQLSCAEENLVLAGDLVLNGKHHGHHGYLFLPSGAQRSDLRSENGAVVLTMFDREPELVANTQAEPGKGVHLDPYQMPWLGGAKGSVTGKPLSNGLATKLLRRDADTGEQSFLYSSHAHHPPPGIMVGKFGHPMVEEIFVLSGEFAFADLGIMRAGGYCWWREGEYHGPVGSRMGYLMFIRNLEGPLENEFPQEPFPFSYQPDHQPVLPEVLLPYGQPLQDLKRW